MAADNEYLKGSGDTYELLVTTIGKLRNSLEAMESIEREADVFGKNLARLQELRIGSATLTYLMDLMEDEYFDMIEEHKS